MTTIAITDRESSNSSFPGLDESPILHPRLFHQFLMHRFYPILWRLMLTLIALAVFFGIMAFLFPRQILTVDSGDVTGDVIVVLGGGADQGRPEQAAELFKSGRAPVILVSGRGDYEPTVRLLNKNNVPNDAIKIESTSKSTLENAKFSVSMLRGMGAHSVIIVTSWYHSRRALACFRHVAPDLKFYSCPSYRGYQPREWSHYSMTGYVGTEYVKLLGYWLWYGVRPWS
jgi:uncharacterized SAM-binding protein YcdF (DUF218 family)